MKNSILIVDDDPLNIEVLNMTLKNTYNVKIAYSAEQTLFILKNQTIDIALFDINMEEMDGFELASTLLNTTTIPNIPFLFVSSFSDENTIQKGLELGAKDFIIKPFNTDILLKKVKTHLLDHLKYKEIESKFEIFSNMFHKNSSNMILVDSLTFEIVDSNQSWNNFYGSSELNLSFDKLFTNNDFKTYIENITVNENFKYETSFTLSNNNIVFVEINSSPIVKCSHIYWFLIIQDITSKKELELFKKRELELKKQEEKYNTINETIFNIAHQWRQPLNMISISASSLLLLKEMGTLSDEKYTEHLNIINNQTKFLSDIIDDFKVHIDTSNIDFEEIKPQDLFETFSTVSKDKLSTNNIKLITNFEDIPFIGNKEQLLEYFQIFLDNSIDSFNLKEDNTENIILINYNKINGVNLFNFIDNGIGVSPEAEEKAFEPYFTTKHQYVGVGLSLNKVQKNIKQLKKSIIDIGNICFSQNNHNYEGCCVSFSFQDFNPLDY